MDDDPETLQLVRAALGESRWHIAGATDRHAAGSMLREHQSDVMLLNLEVSKEERLDLLWLMRQIRPRTRIILITPSGSPSDVLRAVRDHVFSYFTKPLIAESLKEMIERAAAADNWEDGIEVLSARPGWISLRLRCRQLTADRLLQFFRELATPLTDLQRENLATAFRIVFMDAIEHGAGDRYQTIEVTYFHTARSIIYLVQHRFEGFAYEHLQHSEGPVMTAPGLGLLAAQLLVDEVVCNEKGNEVLLIKYLST